MTHGRDNTVSSVVKKVLTCSTYLNARAITTALVTAAFVVNTSALAFANPVLDNVANGNVQITKQSLFGAFETMTVKQTSDRAIINWKDFSIKADQHTEFKQPNAGSITLNRVTGNNLSNIQGRLTSNGTIILVNPNGVLFGKTSVVNVGSLVATTAGISNEDFTAGKTAFNIEGKAGASIVNQGTILVKDGGIGAFVAPSVRNEGIIYGNASTITLAGGDVFTIDLYGDGLVNLQVGTNTAAKSVENEGAILNPEGTVALTTNDARGIVNNVVNMGTVKQASSARVVGKSIILDAGSNGTVEVAGNLNASGLANGGLISKKNGGSIKVAGGKVSVKKDAKLDASGSWGGNGGAITVRSNNTNTNVEGQLDARQSVFGGTGGTIDISGKEFFLAGVIEAGKGGTITIDPSQLFVRNGDGGITPAANSVYEAWLEQTSQNGTNVVLTASELIRVEDIADGEITGGSGDISLLANEGGSTLGAVEFANKTNTIKTTTGKIVVEAGKGGINIGNLRVEAGDTGLAYLRVKTVNGGTITARELKAEGKGEATVDVNSHGAVEVKTITAKATNVNGDANAVVNVKTAKAGSNILIDNLTATSETEGKGDLNAITAVTVDSAGDTTIKNVKGTATAKTIAPAPQSARLAKLVEVAETGNINADAKVKISSKGKTSLTVRNEVTATVEAVSGNSEALNAYSATANAVFDARASREITAKETVVNATTDVTGDAYKKVSATAASRVAGGLTADVSGKTAVNAASNLLDSKKVGLSDVIGDATAEIAGDAGVTSNGKVDVTSKVRADGIYVDNIKSNAIATINSKNGDIIVNAPVTVKSNALGSGAVPLDVLVEFLSVNGEFVSSFGIYDVDSKTGQFIWSNVKEATRGNTFSMTVADLEKNGFFLIPEAAGRDPGLFKDGDVVTFTKVDGKWTSQVDGQTLKGDTPFFTTIKGATGKFETAGVNVDPEDYVFDSPTEGNSNWEDIPSKIATPDYNDVNVNVTTNEGEKGTAYSNAKFVAIASNGEVTVNGVSDVRSEIDIDGNGYRDIKTQADSIFKAGESLNLNKSVTTVAKVDSLGTTTGKVVSDARTTLEAHGKTGYGNININGALSNVSRVTQIADVANAIIKADAADAITFGDNVADPKASTVNYVGPDSAVQGRVSLQQKVGSGKSQLVLTAQKDPEPVIIEEPEEPELPPVDPEEPGEENPGGENPGGENPGGENPGGENPGGNNGGGTPTPPAAPLALNTDALTTTFISPLQRFLISLRDAGLLEYDSQRPYTVNFSGLNLSLLLPGNGATPTAGLSPEQLGGLAPAAGGDTPTSVTINCANSVLDSGYGASAGAAACSAAL